MQRCIRSVQRCIDAPQGAALRGIVRGQTDLPDAQKILLGLTIPAPRRRAIPRPSQGPRLSIASMTGRTAEVRLTNAELEAGRSKPPGIQGG